MIKNSLKIALRGYFRNRIFTALNLFSLIIGLFVAYVGISYIKFELSYDKFHADSDNIYRLARTYRSQDYSVIGFPNYQASEADVQQRQIETLKGVSGVKNAVQFINSPYNEFVESGENQVEEDGILTTNTPEAFTSVFTWKTLNGSLQSFAKGTNKVVLTVSTAEKLFGKENVTRPDIINEAVKIGEETYALAAIIEDVPTNSHFNFNIALSQPKLDYWGSRIYIQKIENSKVADVENQLNQAYANFNPDLAEDELYKSHFLQPIAGIHLNSNILYELKTPGNKKYITLIGFFALFIIIITLFNYANLSLAIKSKQSKAIGVRKAMGARGITIALQIVFEGILLAFISLPVVTLLIWALVPYFNNLMGVSLSANLLAEPIMLLLLISLAVVIGVLASLSPAVLLSMKDTVSLFKENLQSNQFKNFTIRKYLVISQLAILITITSVSYFIFQQLDFIENKDIGFKKEGIIYAYTSPENLNVFQEKLRQIPGVETVGNGSTFGIEPFNQMTYKLQGEETVFDDSHQLYLDFEAVKAYGLKTTLNEMPTTRTTLINRTAAEKLAAYKKMDVNDLIGKTIVTEPEYVNEENGEAGFPFVIGGIFEDINLFSLHEKVEPYFLTLSSGVRMDGRSIISCNTENEAAVLEKINAIYASLNELIPLETEFLGQNVTKLYEQDRQTADLLLYFNVIAVLLASLGIIGITIFLTVARTKEIGIRKVLGASVFSIIKSVINEYIMLVGIALVISLPLAFYTTKEWLSNFAYQADVKYFMVILVGFTTFVFTAFIVGVIAYKAAQANPVKSLKTE
jgi:putative ABC transport system permease protein